MTFIKGDPRINRNGRPKSFDAWRNLTIDVLREPAKDAKGNEIIIDGHVATNAEMIARSWMKDPKRQQALIEAAFGKVPQAIELTGQDGGPLQFDYTRFINTATRPVQDSDAPGQDESNLHGSAVG